MKLRVFLAAAVVSQFIIWSTAQSAPLKPADPDEWSGRSGAPTAIVHRGSVKPAESFFPQSHEHWFIDFDDLIGWLEQFVPKSHRRL